MTDKEIFDDLKKVKRKRSRQVKLLKFLQSDVNRKLLFGADLSEEDRENYIVQLREIELSKLNAIRNKYQSGSYSFKSDNIKLQSGK